VITLHWYHHTTVVLYTWQMMSDWDPCPVDGSLPWTCLPTPSCTLLCHHSLQIAFLNGQPCLSPRCSCRRWWWAVPPIFMRWFLVTGQTCYVSSGTLVLAWQCISLTCSCLLSSITVGIWKDWKLIGKKVD